ncbi:MAG: hypothetical protein ACYST9_00335 [Planctomycetota bacterium]|jgi:hypothetical protein
MLFHIQNMIGRTALLLMVLLAGCRDAQFQVSTERIDTAEGMIRYLRQANLPALKTVENWQNQYGPGLKITTEHYEILTTLLEPLMLRELPAFMESCHRAYNSQLAKPIQTMAPLRVYLFADRNQWEVFTRFFASRRSHILLKIKSGAYYLNDRCVAYNIGRQRTFSAIAHEGWHHFNSRHFKFRLPSWLDEGVATLFETNVERQGFYYFEPDKNISRLAALKNTLAKNRMIPLARLVGTNPGEVIYTEQSDDVMAFYGQAYALVRFLREDDYGKRLGDYRQLLDDGLNGKWPLRGAEKKIAMDRNIELRTNWNRKVGTELFTQYIDKDFEKIEKEYVEFCKKIVYHVRIR